MLSDGAEDMGFEGLYPARPRQLEQHTMLPENSIRERF